MDETTRTPKKGPRTSRTWQERFLASLTAYGNVSAAAKAAKVARSFVYLQRDADAEFKTAWDAALVAAVEGLEYEAWRRGQRGVLEPVYQGGKEVGHIRKYSDTLLIFLLKAHDPKYRDTVRNEHTGPDGGAIVITAIEVVRPDGDGSR
jgi:hypothetical protein